MYNQRRFPSLVFTLVCAYRALLPRVDVPRVCWWDSAANAVLYGRAAATAAELLWAVQLAVVMERLSRDEW